MTDKINARQASILSAIVIFTNKLLNLSSTIFVGAQIDGFFIYIIYFIIDILAVCALLSFKKKYPNTKFCDILGHKFGKLTVKILMIFFMIFFLAEALLLVNEGFVFVRDCAYEDVSLFIFLVCLFPVAMYAVNTGLRGMGRVAEFYFKFIMFGIIICAVIGVTKIDILPNFFMTDFGAFSFTWFSHLFWFTDFVFLFIILDHTDNSKDLPKKMFSYIISSIVLMLVITYSFYAVYPNTGLLHGNAILDLSKLSSDHGGIGRIDIVAILTVMFLLFIEFSIILWSFCHFCRRVLLVEIHHTLWIFAVLFIIIQYLVVSNLENATNFSEFGMSFFSALLLLVISVMLIVVRILDRKKGKVTYEKLF